MTISLTNEAVVYLLDEQARTVAHLYTLMKRYISYTAVFILSGMSCRSEVAKPVEVKASFPAVWEQAGPQARLEAVKAAEIEGDRQLVERIFGTDVDSETKVGDLALVDDVVKSASAACLVGATSVGETEYFDDGRVQVVRAVKVRELVDSLNQVIKGKKLDNGAFEKLSEKTEVKRVSNEKVIEVLGNAALPGSLGHAKVMAKRAAELDAYRKLAGRIMGTQITSNTTVKDFCLKNDELVAALSHAIKGAKTTDIKFISDGSCEVTMQLTMKEIIRTTRRYVDSKVDKLDVKDEVKEDVFTETGTSSDKKAADDTVGNYPFSQTEVIIRESLGSTPVVE